MKLIAVLTALVALPLGASLGYVAKPNPDLPKFGEYVHRTDAVKHQIGGDTDDWFAVAVDGPNKGGGREVVQALSFFRTHKDLERSAQGHVVYLEMKCVSYTTTGKAQSPTDDVLIKRCTQEPKTRKQAEEYMTELLAPEPKA